jgi:hypothetical protein
MQQLNERLESPTCTMDEIMQDIPANMWDTFLWRVDATTETSAACTLNEMHLMFLIVARIRYKNDKSHYTSKTVKIQDIVSTPAADIFQVPVIRMRLRMLMDSIDNIKIMWKDLLQQEDLDACYLLIEALTTAVGHMCYADNSMLDYEDMLDIIEKDKRILSTACIRKLSSFLYLAYRHMHLAASAIELHFEEELQLDLHAHLTTASLDDFYKISMYYDCNIADVLHYRHEFSQMFHSISQVMFYNNSQYARRKQRPHMQVISGEYAEHMLPLIMQLFPEVRVLYEDDVLPVDFAIPGSCDTMSKAEELPALAECWLWWILPAKIYLLNSVGNVFVSHNLVPLVNVLAAAIKR